MTGVYGNGVRSDSLRQRFAPPPLAAHACRYATDSRINFGEY